ncbi:MAG: peroxiredoxin [Firmicutes bacterium]|nr:peroxiredoxin [Bacillota bacterium]
MNYLDIKLPGSDLKTHTLRDFSGSKVVLYFYPKDQTPGCTVEAREFTKLKEEFNAKGYIIIGVNRDSVKSHLAFIQNNHLNLLLLSDESEELVRAFSVLVEKSMFGKKYLGIERSTFVLGESGQIQHEYRKVSPKEHPVRILEEL